MVFATEPSRALSPWGAEVSATWEPMLVPAPARFSTTTCCGSCSESFCATRRAVTSTELPGAEGGPSAIGFEGQDCASSAPGSANSIPSAMNRFMRPPRPSPGAIYADSLHRKQQRLDDHRHHAGLRHHFADVDVVELAQP